MYRYQAGVPTSPVYNFSFLSLLAYIVSYSEDRGPGGRPIVIAQKCAEDRDLDHVTHIIGGVCNIGMSMTR